MIIFYHTLQSMRFYVHPTKFKLKETGLYYMKFSLVCVTHHCCLEHDNHDQYTLFDWPVFCTYPDPSHRFNAMGPKGFLKFPCKTYVFCTQLRYGLLYICNILKHRSVAKLRFLSISLKPLTASLPCPGSPKHL